MAAIKMEELEKLEAEYGVEADDLTYQQRCSRITALQKGDEWKKPEKKDLPKTMDIRQSPIYGKRIMISPLMLADANRHIYYEEELDPEIEVKEVHAGEELYSMGDDVQRMVGDYKIVGTNPDKKVVAKTTFPKINTEITYTIGVDLVPVVRGSNGDTGYIWKMPLKVVHVDEDNVVQICGLKNLISSVYPELLPKFQGKPMMSYIDGVTLVASIPQTKALLHEKRLQVMKEKRAGL